MCVLLQVVIYFPTEFSYSEILVILFILILILLHGDILRFFLVCRLPFVRLLLRMDYIVFSFGNINFQVESQVRVYVIGSLTGDFG